MTDDFIPLATLSEAEVLERFARVVAESLRIPPARVALEANLFELGAESIDIVEITLDVEHAFSIVVPEHSVLDLACEVSGDDRFVRDGEVTEEGIALLRDRLPQAAAAALAPGVLAKDLAPTLMRVDVWVRLIGGLLGATPRVCTRCGGRLVQGSPARVKCRSCAIELDVPSGDEIGRQWVGRWMAGRA